MSDVRGRGVKEWDFICAQLSHYARGKGTITYMLATILIIPQKLKSIYNKANPLRSRWEIKEYIEGYSFGELLNQLTRIEKVVT